VIFYFSKRIKRVNSRAR